MKADIESPKPTRIVIVVGVDLSDVSEHLLAQTRALIRPVDESEVHIAHVVHPDALRQQIERPVRSEDIGARSHIEYAKWELKRLSDSLALGPRTRVVVHTPVGETADELARIATDVSADILVIEAHDHAARGPRRVFHRSVLARIARMAPCTVLTIRKPKQSVVVKPTAKPESASSASAPASH